MSIVNNALPSIAMKWNRADINTSAGISGQPAIPLVQGGGGVLQAFSSGQTDLIPFNYLTRP